MTLCRPPPPGSLLDQHPAVSKVVEEDKSIKLGLEPDSPRDRPVPGIEALLGSARTLGCSGGMSPQREALHLLQTDLGLIPDLLSGPEPPPFPEGPAPVLGLIAAPPPPAPSFMPGSCKLCPALSWREERAFQWPGEVTGGAVGCENPPAAAALFRGSAWRGPSPAHLFVPTGCAPEPAGGTGQGAGLQEGRGLREEPGTAGLVSWVLEAAVCCGGRCRPVVLGFATATGEAHGQPG